MSSCTDALDAYLNKRYVNETDESATVITIDYHPYMN